MPESDPRGTWPAVGSSRYRPPGRWSSGRLRLRTWRSLLRLRLVHELRRNELGRVGDLAALEAGEHAGVVLHAQEAHVGLRLQPPARQHPADLEAGAVAYTRHGDRLALQVFRLGDAGRHHQLEDGFGYRDGQDF